MAPRELTRSGPHSVCPKIVASHRSRCCRLHRVTLECASADSGEQESCFGCLGGVSSRPFRSRSAGDSFYFDKERNTIRANCVHFEHWNQLELKPQATTLNPICTQLEKKKKEKIHTIASPGPNFTGASPLLPAIEQPAADALQFCFAIERLPGHLGPIRHNSPITLQVIDVRTVDKDKRGRPRGSGPNGLKGPLCSLAANELDVKCISATLLAPTNTGEHIVSLSF